MKIVVFGLSVTFMKVKDGKLDPTDKYESDWVGRYQSQTGGGRLCNVRGIELLSSDVSFQPGGYISRAKANSVFS